MVLKLDMRDVAGGASSFYVAHFRLVETKNGKEIVLSQPSLMTAAERPAKLMVGQVKGDRIEVDLTVREVVSATSSLGTSQMKMVNLPIIIQDEEDRMEIQSSP